MKSWYFFVITLVLAAVTFAFRPELFMPALVFFVNLLKRIVPIMLIVFAIMFLIDLFVTPKQLVKHMQKKKGWVVAVVTGIISVGPIYMWYPLLSDLKDKGVRTAYIAAFLYNRAVKPALLPLIIFYFGLKYTIVLTIIMVVASVFQGLIVEKIVGVEK